MQFVFEEPAVAYAVLGREYNSEIDTPERFIFMLSEVANVPFNTFIAVSQHNVPLQLRVTLLRMFLVGIIQVNTEYIRRVINGKEISPEFTWKGWLAQYWEHPEAPGSIPQEMKQGYQTYEMPVFQIATPEAERLSAPVQNVEYLTGQIDISQLLQRIDEQLQRNFFYTSRIEELEKENKALTLHCEAIEERARQQEIRANSAMAALGETFVTLKSMQDFTTDFTLKSDKLLTSLGVLHPVEESEEDEELT